jgi:hypothetical protein
MLLDRRQRQRQIAMPDAVLTVFAAGIGFLADIVFTADVLDSPTLARIAELKVPVNAGSVDMLHQL